MKRQAAFMALSLIMTAALALPKGGAAAQAARAGVSAAPVDGDAAGGTAPGAVGGPDTVKDEAPPKKKGAAAEEDTGSDEAITDDDNGGGKAIDEGPDAEESDTAPDEEGLGRHAGKEKKRGFSVLSERERFGIFAGYGGYVPLGDYGARYLPAHMASVTASVLYLDIVGISPELHFRYAYMKSKKDPGRYGSTLAQAQFFPGLIYRYEFRLPAPMTGILVFGRIWDGVSQVTYKSVHPGIPVLKRVVTEYINTFGISAGAYVDLWKGIMAGVELGYTMTATGGSPIHAFTAGLSVGYRI